MDNKKIFTIQINGVEESYANVKELAGGITQLEQAVKNAKVKSPELGALTDQLGQARKVLAEVSKSTFTVKVAGLDITTRNAGELKGAITQLEAKLKNATPSDANYAKLGKTLAAAKTKYDELTHGVENLSNVFKKGSLVLKIDGVDTAVNNVNQLEEAIERLQEKANNAEFGTTELKNLQLELTKARTKLEQMEQAPEQLTAERRIETISNVTNGMVGAFGAATGAVKVFGSGLGISDKTIQKYEENVQATLLIVQGFTSVTQALSGETLKNIKVMSAEALSFLGVGEAAEEAGVAAKGFGLSAKSAIAATGIGLLLIAVIAIYDNFDKLKSLAGTVGDYLKAKFGGVIDVLSAIKDGVRNILNVASFGLIDDATAAHKKALEDAKKTQAKADADKLAAGKDLYNAQLAALDLSEKRKLELQKNYDALTYKRLVESGKATADELKAQQLATIASTTAYNQKIKELAKAAVEGDEANRVKQIELSKGSELQKAKLLIAAATATRDRVVAEGKATKQEIDSLNLDIQSAANAYRDKLNEKQAEQIQLTADFAKREIALSNKTEAEKLAAVVKVEEKTLTAIKAAFPTKLKEIKEQEEKIKEAKKAATDGNVAFLVEQNNKEAETKKRLIDLNENNEIEALRQKSIIDQKSVDALKKIAGVKEEVIKEANFKSLESQKTYNDANLALEITNSAAALDLLKARVDQEKSITKDRLGYLVNEDLAIAKKYLDIEEKKLANLKASGKATVAEIKAQEAAVVNAMKDVAKVGASAFSKAFKAAQNGQSFLASLIGGDELQSLIDGNDAINSIIADAQDKRLTAQIEGFNNQISYLDSVIDNTKSKVDELNDEINSSVNAQNDLEKQLLTAKGADRDNIIRKIDIERQKQQQLNQQKIQEDAREKRASAEKAKADAAKIAAEEELAKSKEKTNQVAAIAATIDKAAAAASAVSALVGAVKAAASVPFPANIPALAISVLATGSAIAGAIASAKAIKFADGGSFTSGLVEGRSHQEGGIPMRYNGSIVAEMEGGEHITRKAATARNLQALDTINRLGDKTTFRVIPAYASGGRFVGNFTQMETSSKPDNRYDEKIAGLTSLVYTSMETAIALSNRPIETNVVHVTDAQSRQAEIKNNALK